MTKRNNCVEGIKLCAFICFVCIVLCVVMASLPIINSSADSTKGTISIELKDKDRQPVNDIAVKITKIASISGTDYFPEEAFSVSGINVADIVNDPSAERASSIYEYAESKGVLGIVERSSNGCALFSSLEKGIWLVSCQKNQSHTFAPFFMFLPNTLNGENGMYVSASPKVEEDEPDNRIISVTKIWNDGQNKAGKRPESIKVTLERNGLPIADVVLSNENGWTHFFEKLPDDGEYTVKEDAVDYYDPEYSGDADNGFVITNTYTGDPPPQTGGGYMMITGGIAMVSAIVLFATVCVGKRKKFN